MNPENAKKLAEEVGKYLSAEGFPERKLSSRDYVTIIYPGDKGTDPSDINPGFDSTVRWIAGECGVDKPTGNKHIFVTLFKYPDDDTTRKYRVIVSYRYGLYGDDTKIAIVDVDHKN